MHAELLSDVRIFHQNVYVRKSNQTLYLARQYLPIIKDFTGFFDYQCGISIAT